MRGDFLLAFLLAISPIACAIMDADLIISYLQYKFLQIGSVFTCLPKRDQITLAKGIMKEGFRFTIFNIDNNFDVIHTISSQNNVALILDATCNNVTLFLKTCERQNLFDTRKHWLLVGRNGTLMSALDNIHLNIIVDLNVALPINNSNANNWEIFDVYNPAYRHGGTLKITYIGYWNKIDGYQMKFDKSIYIRRRNMTGTHFKAMIVLAYPYPGTLDEYLNSNENRGIDSYNRVSYRSLQYCQEFYNFTMHNSISESWGYRVGPNNTFDGLVGALQRKEVDFGSGVFYKADRIPIIDYGAGVWILRHAFIFRNPLQSPSFTVFLAPLSPPVWYSATALIIVIIPILKYALNIEYKHIKHVKQLCENSWSFLILLAIGSMCQQGSEGIPYLYCGRIVIITILLFSILLFQVYSGSIVSNLLSKPPTMITSLDGLLRSDLDVSCENVLYIKDFFRQLTNPVALQLYQKKIITNGLENYMTPTEGLKRVYGGKFAYHVELSSAYPIIERTFPNSYICDLREIQMIPPKYIFAPFQENSPFLEMINFCIRRLGESGISQYLVIKWRARKPTCFQETYKSDSIGLPEFYPVLMALVIGIVASLIVLVIEIIVHRKVTEDEKKLKPMEPFIN